MSLENYLRQVQQDGLSIETVYDIGANNGYWSNAIRQLVLPNSYFYLFEGNAKHESALQSIGLPYYIGILSNPGRDYVDFYDSATTGDSYYKENTVHYDNKTATRFPACTLESVVQQGELPIPNFIKIDTQGSELDVLRGAESFLNQVDLIYLECPIIEYNLGAPTIQDYLDYMREQKFVPTDILEVHRNENVLLQVDIMFINNDTKNRLYGPTQWARPLR
jgi:FkbM family methyltransferase